MTKCLAPKCLAPKCASQAQAGPFCEIHAKASSGRRGGWVSAARRKPYDATVIAPRLWIGSSPPTDRDLPKIDVLVLCAQEIQPEFPAFHGVVFRCPIPDAEIDALQLRLVAQTAVAAAGAIVRGRRVLVTCRTGLNRSALVVALALHQLTTMNAEEIVDHIRLQRGRDALSNRNFVAIIRQVIGDGRPKVRRRHRDTVA